MMRGGWARGGATGRMGGGWGGNGGRWGARARIDGAPEHAEGSGWKGGGRVEELGREPPGREKLEGTAGQEGR
eukprot:85220-Chlamydomonas_euryale.AAC.1